ncbi:MAG: hypothetical protein ACM3SR_14565 [Ignavibacteriales bacterium]
MLTNQSVTNEKPRDLAVTKSQGKGNNNGNGNFTPMLKDSKSRYDKGMGLYKEGKVKVSSNGLFKISGYYECDPEKMTCTCPDYRTRKEACKHLFAAMLFVKNRGRTVIQDLDGFTWVDEIRDMPSSYDKPKPEAKDTSDKPTEAPTKPFDRQSTITRLAVLNTATEILKTHSKPIEFNDIVSLAAQLEQWALGGD